jgi:hypothetical protein
VIVRVTASALLLACGTASTPAVQQPPPREATAPMPAERHWSVFDGNTQILEISDHPGPIVSTAELPPGQSPVTSPFMSATSRDAGHENQLYTILVASHDLDGFLAGLRAAGFDVRAVH